MCAASKNSKWSGFMRKIKQYKIVPDIPQDLQALKTLSLNLYWSWEHDIRNLFRRLDRRLWDEIRHNPVELLSNIDQRRLEARATDEGYLSHLLRAREALSKYESQKSWYQKNYDGQPEFHIAYFSMEYGLAPALPIYSGGVGVLAGDHLKSASDLGLPLVAVGLLYQEGYFHQYLSSDGWQQEDYPKLNFHTLPIEQVYAKGNDPLTISLNYPGRTIYAQIWKAQVGHVPLYLLDTNISQNSAQDQNLTDRLYGGDTEKRIQQEILLGIGGIRALDALGIQPHVCHMNEGHSAFMALERARLLMLDKNLNFRQAHEATRGGNVFTSHTPVPAGIDEFDAQMVDHYLGAYYDSLQISQKEFHQLGGVHLPETHGKFNMAIFAINMAGSCNGVSKLHGRVARNMWHYLWPDLNEHEVPIGHITNGIHLKTWVSEDLAELFNYYLGPRWYTNPVDPSTWSRIQYIPDEELWRTHERRREQLVAFSRKHLARQLTNSGASANDIESASQVLNPKALTIGFARRFAAYKRAFLLFKDLDRLKKIVSNAEYPVQIIFAGKAHPHDHFGKNIIRDIVTTIRHSDLRNRIVFLEDYDMMIASYLVSGVDIWLNTPRRPREASGTSGMKAGANGALNVSVPDGWWDEAHQNNIGWTIGRGEVYSDLEEQDRVESESLYYLLESEIVPCFYDRGSSSIPSKWIRLMKNSIQHVAPNFNTHRMVEDYHKTAYIPASERWNRLISNNMSATKTLVEWKKRIYANWDKISILSVESDLNKELIVGQDFHVQAQLTIDGLTPDDLHVEVYYGPIGSDGEINEGDIVEMTADGKTSGRKTSFQAKVPCRRTGVHGFTVRVLPYHAELTNPHEMGLLTWYGDKE